jgi:hypothetical protein
VFRRRFDFVSIAQIFYAAESFGDGETNLVANVSVGPLLLLSPQLGVFKNVVIIVF